MSASAVVWPPNHKVRYSKRAKNLSLRITTQRELELVIPNGVSDRAANNFLNNNRNWVEKHAHLIDTRETVSIFPDTISFPICNQKWTVEHMPLLIKGCICKEVDSRLLICSKEFVVAASVAALQKWLRKKAKSYLPARLAQFSNKLGLKYSKVVVRGQKSIWGSCSADAVISLNDKLLFMQPNVVDYVLIHELCHLVYPNHSRDFWRLVAKFLPEYSVCIKQLRLQEKSLPKWVNYM